MRTAWMAWMMVGLVACGDEESKPEATDTGVLPEGATPGDCSDGEDNDGDGLTDCDDDGCAGASACDEPDSEDTGEEAPPWPITIDMKPELMDFVDVSVLPEDADFSCMETGWVEDSFSASLQGESEYSATTTDVFSGAVLPAVRVEVFGGDDPTGSPVSDEGGQSSGAWTGILPTCTPTATRAYSDPVIGETFPTVQLHTVMAPSVEDHNIQVVSLTTHNQMRPLVGGEPSTDKGILFGQVRDCAGQALRGAQIVLVDGGGAPLADQQRFYVEADGPSATRTYTTENGWWIAAEVPTGAWTVSVWVNDPDWGHIQVAETSTHSMVDDFTTGPYHPFTVWSRSDAHVGHNDGIVYPDSCTE